MWCANYALGTMFDILRDLTARTRVWGSGWGLTLLRRDWERVECSCWLTSADGDTTREKYFPTAGYKYWESRADSRATVVNVEVKLVVFQHCYCHLCQEYRGWHCCKSEKDQQGDILSKHGSSHTIRKPIFLKKEKSTKNLFSNHTH